MWANEAVFYQIYPLGFCGAPQSNDGVLQNRISKVIEWIPHIKKLGAGAVYFCPIFQSDNHGYDTRTFSEIDCRLGGNEDFKTVCEEFHKKDIKVVLDGVFNHVGRGFWAFEDVLKNRESSQYKDWFYINFDGNNGYNDGLWYEGWEGHFELVKLNLSNSTVVEHIFCCIENWIKDFDIDGLRLDVAYSLPEDFMRKLRSFCDSKKSDFFLVGEMIHGDYNRIVNPQMLDSSTNYECYKGLYSSFNSLNMFEISYSLNRQFGPEDWTLYKGLHLMSFADNHDVTRLYSVLENKNHLLAAYAVLLAMPGIPCIYYGSEWGAAGEKSDGDNALRPCFAEPIENEIFEKLARLIEVRNISKALTYGSFKNETVTNKQWIMRRECEGETIFAAVNADSENAKIHLNFNGTATELITEKQEKIENEIELKAYEVKFLRA